MLGQKESAPGPALEQHKSDGEADGDVATGRAGVLMRGAGWGGTGGDSTRENLSSCCQNWSSLKEGTNDSGVEGREEHSLLQKQLLQIKVQGGELRLGAAGLGRCLGQLLT